MLSSTFYALQIYFLGCVAPVSAASQSAAPRDTSVPTPPAAVHRTWVAPLPDSLARAPAPLMPTPAVVHGLYVNRWAAIGTKVWQLIDLAKRTGINAFVIDVKDDRGFVLYRSHVPLAREIGADTIRPLTREHLRTLLDTLRLHGIYPIARIVVAKDPLLAERRPAWAIRSRRDPAVAWRDRQGRPWWMPTSVVCGNTQWISGARRSTRGSARYSSTTCGSLMTSISMREAVFPLANGRTRAQVIREQLGFVHSALSPLGVQVTADVFGLTASDTTDMGIGQRWEMFVDQVDVVLPMSYPSHYAPGTYDLTNPNAHPYAVIDHTLKDAARRSARVPGAATLRPWYQDFTLGPPHYTPEFVRAQIRAGYDNGVRSWLLWNPGSRYGEEELREPATAGAGAARPQP